MYEKANTAASANAMPAQADLEVDARAGENEEDADPGAGKRFGEIADPDRSRHSGQETRRHEAKITKLREYATMPPSPSST